MLNISQLFDMSINLSGSQLLFLADKRTKPHQVHFPALGFLDPCFLCNGGSIRADLRKNGWEKEDLLLQNRKMQKRDKEGGCESESTQESQNSDLRPPPPSACLFNKYLLVLVNTYITLLCASSCSKGLYKDELTQCSGEKCYYV